LRSARRDDDARVTLGAGRDSGVTLGRMEACGRQPTFARP
jgi:hypothetical protein